MSTEAEARRALIPSLVRIELPKYFWCRISLLSRFNAQERAGPRQGVNPGPCRMGGAFSEDDLDAVT